MRVLLVLLVVLCVALFVFAVVAPERSRRLQGWYDRALRRGERKGDRDAGKLGDMTESGLKGARRLGDASAEGGRNLSRKLRRQP